MQSTHTQAKRPFGRPGPLLGLLAALLLTSAAAAQPSLEFNIGGSGPRMADGFGEVSDPEDDAVAQVGKGGESIMAGCLTNRQVRRGLRGHDFDNIKIGRAIRGDVFEVQANYGGSLYRMTLDRCSGKVSDVEKLGRNRVNGVGLQFGY